ncbi:MAG: hypothetical protein JW829_13535 [Pirellulales bacterium]|nr:hypothetical protein [Pirellulales bacterium]
MNLNFLKRLIVAVWFVTGWNGLLADAGDLTIRLVDSENVTFVGAMDRWDAHGDPRRPVDPKAKIDVPAGYLAAHPLGTGRWQFKDLSPGRYDLVVLIEPRIRIEGFHYPPVREFDPFMFHTADARESDRKQVARDISQTSHYENQVIPLYFAGEDKQIRVLVQLLRDKPTSYDTEYGEQIATLRHEVWQYTNQYGSWVKEKRTRLFDRILMPKRELRQWTWIWLPELGGIEVTQKSADLEFQLPNSFDSKQVRGLVPY